MSECVCACVCVCVCVCEIERERERDLLSIIYACFETECDFHVNFETNWFTDVYYCGTQLCVRL